MYNQNAGAQLSPNCICFIKLIYSKLKHMFHEKILPDCFSIYYVYRRFIIYIITFKDYLRFNYPIFKY